MRWAPWSGEDEPYCETCGLWIHPLYAQEVVTEEEPFKEELF